MDTLLIMSVYAKNIGVCLRCISSREGRRVHCPENVCICPVDALPIISHAKADRCPAELFASRNKSTPGQPEVEEAYSPDLSQLWIDLHRRAVAYPETATIAIIASELAWLTDQFRPRIHCGGCRTEWDGILSRLPPTLGTREAYFAWTVAAHNAVNEKLGHEAWTVERAKAEYRFS